MKNRKENTESVKVTKELFLLEKEGMLSVRGGINSDRPNDTDVHDYEELE